MVTAASRRWPRKTSAKLTNCGIAPATRRSFLFSAYYDGRATGNLEKAEQTCSLWVQTYPRERLPHSFLAGFIYPASGRYEKSIEEAQKVMRDRSGFYIPLRCSCHRLHCAGTHG